MALVNMKQKKKSKSNMKAEVPSTEEQDRYPYGLEIHLGNDEMKRLGLTAANYPAKTKCTIVAEGYVERVSSRQTIEGGMKEDMTIQITDLSVKSKSKPSAYHMYNNAQKAGPGEQPY